MRQALNACPPAPTVEVHGRVTVETHGPCAAETEVVRITLAGVGHHWPGAADFPDDPLDGTEAVWEFFAQHPKVTPAAS